MAFSAEYIPYKATRSFSALAADYIEGIEKLRTFYRHTPDIAGIENAIACRKKMATNRVALVNQLKTQYAGLALGPKLQANIDSLLRDDTFTVTTAHQPNIFTGHLYFIYKILHAVKLADDLNTAITTAHFIPVFYMGSEDADLEELGEVTINGKKYTWETRQAGAVGRMKVDKAFLDLITAIDGQLSVTPLGKEIMEVVKKTYVIGTTIELATLELVHTLFGDYGLVVLLPDNAVLKKEFIPISTKELNEHFSSRAVAATIARFPAEYKVQAAGRDINLFYLVDDIRERIEAKGEKYAIANTKLSFTKAELAEELRQHPERFSPNVILRPVYQELILPNIVFIGGGGELAYWLELKEVFEAAGVPYPVIVLRNSFTVINKRTAEKIRSLGFTATDFFKPADALVKELVEKESAHKLLLDKEKNELGALYETIANTAAAVDITLRRHVAALVHQALKRIGLLEKKMLRAEKKRFETAQRQIRKIKAELFPGGTLQERVDNLLPYYAIWGNEFIKTIYAHSTGLRQEFCLLEEKE